MPYHAAVKMQLLRVVYQKGWGRADKDGASKTRIALYMLLGMMGQKAYGEGSSVGESKDATEGVSPL